MLRILKRRSEELLSLAVVFFICLSAILANDFLFKQEKIKKHISQPRMIIPVTPMTVPVKKKDPPKVYTELECLASVIYHEARGEPVAGQIAVGQVVLNRVKSRHYPQNICSVVFQPHQFTGHKTVKYSKKTKKIAKKVLNKEVDFHIKATHYHADYVFPKWAVANNMIFLDQIGSHLFYKLGARNNTVTGDT